MSDADRARELLASADGRRKLSEAVAKALGCIWFERIVVDSFEYRKVWVSNGPNGHIYVHDPMHHMPPPYASLPPSHADYGRLCFEMIEALRKKLQKCRPCGQLIFFRDLAHPYHWHMDLLEHEDLWCEPAEWGWGIERATLRDALVLALASAGLLKLEDDE